MRIVTNSELTTFKACRLKHHLTYEELLASLKPNKNLRFGTAIHAGLEAFHGGDNYIIAGNAFEDNYREAIRKMEADGVELWEEDYQEFESDIELGHAMIKRYADFNASQEPLEVITLEKQFSVALRTPTGRKARGVTLNGKMDGIVKDIHGNLFLLEHKTAASIDNKYISKLDLDDQVNNYIWGATQAGYPVKGVIYNVLAKWVPHAPALLKSGKLSTDKRQKTTPELYRQAIAANKLNVDDYADMLEHLDAQEDKTFLRLKVYRNDAEIDRIGRELYLTARDMAKPSIYRNPGACERYGCVVRSVCLVDSEDTRRDFRIKKSKHEELEEGEATE